MVVGSTVRFPSFTNDGREVKLVGLVTDEFREPKDEDPYQRLNYVVKCGDGSVHTPYAADCVTI